MLAGVRTCFHYEHVRTPLLVPAGTSFVIFSVKRRAANSGAVVANGTRVVFSPVFESVPRTLLAYLDGERGGSFKSAETLPGIQFCALGLRNL